jgi:nitronate monooxygenase
VQSIPSIAKYSSCVWVFRSRLSRDIVIAVAQSCPGAVARLDGEHRQGEEASRVLNVFADREAPHALLRPAGHSLSDSPGPPWLGGGRYPSWSPTSRTRAGLGCSPALGWRPRPASGGHPGGQGPHGAPLRHELPPGSTGAGQRGHRAQRFLNRFREELDLPPGKEDLILPPSPLPEQLEVVFSERVPVLSVRSGTPVASPGAPGGRALVISMITTVEEAIRVLDGGADVVVAQGAEAGGHRSTFELGPGGEAPLVGTLAVVPQVVNAVGVPVVAAGGIVDGRGLVAALALGAVGAQLGTPFYSHTRAAPSPPSRSVCWRLRIPTP